MVGLRRTGRIPLRVRRRIRILAVLVLTVAVLSGVLVETPPVRAHNLQTRMVYMYLDPPTQAALEARMADPLWAPPDPLLQAGDLVGLIIKVVPRDGTTTGVGGHVDFYVPNGVTVIDAAYVVPDGSGGYKKIGMKGQSPIAIGAGPVGPKTTGELIGLGPRGPNILGVTENPVVPASGLHRGTIAGVYGDTGIFYATDPDLAYGSWQDHTGDAVGKCGTLALDPTIPGKTITNNSGDVVVPCNKWDAEQLFGFGATSTTYSGAALRGGSKAIVDYPDQRGNAPWGFASSVAGPESGYAWEFDWDAYKAAGGDPLVPAHIQAGMTNEDIGPWNRIQYAGSRIAMDQAGLLSTTLGFASVDGGSEGAPLPLPSTTSQTDLVSPKAIRWAVGQLTAFRPEYAFVQIRVDSVHDVVLPGSCPVFRGDTFGGDAGGTDTGKDHLWRYYEPTEVIWNGCLSSGKPATREIVKVGDTYQYNLKVYNMQGFTLNNVYARDTLPSGVSYIGAAPSPNSGPNPLVWNVGTLLPGEMWQATVTVKATSSGYLDNCLTTSSSELPPQTVCDTTTAMTEPYLVPSKSVTPASVAPGGTVQYTVVVDNIGTGPTGNPVTIQEYLPPGFTFLGPTFVAKVNGAVIAAATVNATDPNRPLFTVPAAINAGKNLVLTFSAQVALGTPAGNYCNSYTVTQGGIPLTTGSEGCVDVGGGAIGDRIWRDWDGDGVQDADEEGIAGVVLELQDGTCIPGSCATTTTDATGFYQFTGLVAGPYTVKVLSGVPAGYTLTGDPDQPGAPCTSCDAESTVTLATNEKLMDRDFGYQPGGTGSIGDKVFDDNNNDGVFDGTDAGIPNVTVDLYEDTNGNGVIDPGVDALVATTVTNATGDYSFPDLAIGLKYIVDVDQSDPDIAGYFTTTYGDAINVVQTTIDPHPTGTLVGSYTSADFGFYRTVPGSIGDDVFRDSDGDGVRDAGEPGLPDVSVQLYLDTDGDGLIDPGEPLLETTTTDGDGKYSFTGLPAGSYIVDVVESDPDVPDTLLVERDPIPTTLTAGQQRTDVDFAFVPVLQKSANKSFANPGGNAAERTITYSIVARVPGDTLLAAAVINDTIPAGTTYVAGSVNAGGAAVDTSDPVDGIIDAVTWDLGGNSPGTLGYKEGIPPPACGLLFEVEATDDTDIDLDNPDDNNGNSNRIFTRPSPASQLRFGLLHFALPDLPAAAQLDSAILQLEVQTAQAGHVDEVYRVLTPWQAATATWNDSDGAGPLDWASAGTFGTSDHHSSSLGSITPSTTGIKQLDITSQVEDWYGGINDNVGLALIATGSGNNDVRYYSANEGTASRRPRLIIEATANGCNGTTIIQESGAGQVPDADIDENNPASWQGNSNRLKVQPSPPTDNRYALLKFDLTSVPAGATINTAFMRVEVQSNKNNHVDQVYRMLTPWTEGTSATNGATWNDSNGTGTVGDWVSTGGVFGTSDYTGPLLGTITPNTNGAKTVNVTGQVSDWYNGTHPNNGLVLIATGSDGGEAAYYSSEEGTASRRPSLSVNWSIPPTDPTGTNTITASGMVVQNGDSITFKQVLSNTTAAPIANVVPSSVTIAGTNGANATCGSPTPAIQTVPANGSVTYTRTCTVIAVGTLPGQLTFSASATNGTATWGPATSNGVIVVPVLQFQAIVTNPPGVNVVTNVAEIEDANLGTIPSNPVDVAVSSTIGDRVWIDSDNDGVQDAGEGNVPGVRVFLDTNNDGDWDLGEPFDITDADGIYHIGGLANGTYTVRMDASTLPPDFYPTTPTSLSRTITAFGQQITDADFGVNTGSGQVGDLVWVDTDEDGVFDEGEMPLSGVTVQLYNDVNNNGVVDAGDLFLGSRNTDVAGNYLFDGLYTSYAGGDLNLLADVAAGVPAGLELVDGGTDPHDLSLSPGSPVNLTGDFPYNYGGSIGDFVWYDLDGDQIQDGGLETGAPNTTIVLYNDVNGDGMLDPGDTVVAVTVTDATGAYLFDNLPPGDYIVKADEQQVPAPPSSDHAGEIGRMVSTTGDKLAVTLRPNEDVTDADFGFIEGAEVAGHVFWDEDHNGILDGTDTPIANVTVTLTGTDENGNPVSLSTTTDAGGEYEFIVPPGNYTVTYDTGDADIPAGLTEPTTGTGFTFTVPAGAELEPLDFGRDNPGKLGDRVWLDANGDGAQDAGEPGLASVTVQLYLDADGNPATTGDQTLLETQATDALGLYQFVGLADTLGAERYIVKVDTNTLPAGYTPTGEGDPGTACGGSCDNQIASPLAGGGTVTDVDFGYQPPPTSYSVSGTVWEDNGAGGGTAGDGMQTGDEPGIPDATVCLYDSTGTTVLQCTTTDPNGGYSFLGVPDGSYVVKVDEATLPSAAFVQTGDPDETNTCSNCDGEAPVTVSGAPVVDVDFGYEERLGSISGNVVAGDGDGLAEGGETGQDPVTVVLTGAGPDGIYGNADDTIATTVTDGSGNYTFPDLPPGLYQVTTITPDGKSALADADGANPNSILVNLAVDEDRVDQDFEVAVDVGDQVWLDTDGDGVYDVGEPGLANVDLELWNVGPDGMPGGSDDFLVATTTTDANGNYLFGSVPAGSYFIDVVDGTLPPGLVASPGTIEGPVAGAMFNVDGTADVLDQDFGYTGPPGTAMIGDYVWSDADGDGIQDPGEPGLAGVTLELKGAGADGVLGTLDDTVVDTATTDATGHYLFTGVPPGEYLVDVTDTGGVLAGYSLTAGPESRTDPTVPLSVAAGDVLLDADFGYQSVDTYSLSDRLWYDLDSDGLPDAGEPGIGGVTIDLVDAGGNVIATATTDENGNFHFEGLPDGSYTIRIGDVDNTLSGFGGTTTAGIVGELPVVISGGNVTGENFGYAQPGVIGDTIWSDADADGVQDPNELGIAGVAVDLYTDPNGDGDPSDGVLVASDVTDAGGHYLFSGVPAGNYVVQVTPPAGYLPTGDPDEGGACVVCDDRGSTTLPFAAAGDLTLDFGYSQPALADVSGSVWSDLDKDGVDDGAGEPPIPGVTVCLEDGAGNVVACTTTDDSGSYTFPDVPPGSYTVVVTDTDGVLVDHTLTSGLDRIPITVGGTDITGVDFGYVRDPETGSIGDTVWLDADRDGVQDASENGIGGVLVTLYGAGPDGQIGGADDVLLGTATTDPAGHYTFPNLPAGNYYVAIDHGSLPGGGAGLDETSGGNDDLSGLVNLSEGEKYDDADLGYAPEPGTSAIGDRVWYDTDMDGVQDPGEIGVGGVTITVSGPGCDDCVVVTDPDGSWLVSGLIPGETYDVTISPPAGYSVTNGEDTRTYPMPATPDLDILYADFGLACSGCTGSLGDLVWQDNNGDGIHDPGEPGIAGVTVELVRLGVVVATTTTDADGNYLFVGLPPDTYTVRVTDLNGVLAGLNQSGDPDESGTCVVCDGGASVVVTAGGSVLTADFGYAPTGTSLGNQVWHDLDNDGLFEPDGADGQPGTPDDETPMEGVTVQLWTDVDGNGVYDPGVDNLVRSATTDQNGQYEFLGLTAGDYLVDILPPAGFTLTDGADGVDNNSQADMYAVALAADTPDSTGDFGLWADTAYAISGTVFLDEDNDGILDHPTNDHRIPDIPVYLYQDLDGDGVLDPDEPLIASQISNAIGGYLFPNLPPGDYIVTTDPIGSRLDGLIQTTQTATDAVQPVTIVAGDVTDQDFGFFAPAPIQTTPVTLASFKSTRSGDGVVFEWTTATEFGNVGFHLYAQTDHGLSRVNRELIPTHGQTSMTPASYRFEARGVSADRFFLEDVAWNTAMRRHGPFALGGSFGSDVTPETIDWSAIRAEHEASSRVRDAAERQQVARAFRAAAEREEAGSASDAAAPELTSSAPPVLQLSVDTDGLYRVTYEQLLAEGFDLADIPMEQLAIVSQGQPVPIRTSDEEVFGPGSFVEFYGRAVQTRYTRTNVYHLVLDELQARRVPTLDAAPTGQAAEATYAETHRVDRNRAFDQSAPEGDPWYDTSMLTFTSPRSWTFPLTLDGSVGEGQATLTVALWGVTDWPGTGADHHVKLYLNDVLVAESTFDGRRREDLVAVVPSGLLHSGANTVRLTLPGDTGFDWDMVNLDSYAATYQRPFEARDGALSFEASGAEFEVSGLVAEDLVVYREDDDGLAILSGVDVQPDGGGYRARFAGTPEMARYTVAAIDDLEAPAVAALREIGDLTTGPAEYLVISHPSFLAGIQPLVDFHESRGLSVKVVDVRDVYEAHGHGVFDATAIRRYIAAAQQDMGTRFVLLVGGDTYDYLDYLGVGSMSFVPTLYGDDWSPHVPVDQRHADTDDDGVPDVALGRLPVRTAAELNLAVAKTLAYAGKDYRRTAVLAADRADGELSFSRASDRFAASLPGNWSAARAYLDQIGLAQARAVLLQRINGGVALTSFVGHSSAGQWTFENFFRAADVGSLTNAGRPTVVLQWGCWNTYFLAPNLNTLGHQLLLAGDKGAAAVLGSTTLTSSASEEKLGALAFPRVTQQGMTIGEAILEAKQELAQTDPELSDVLLGWTLLGDPALVVEP